MAVSSSPLWRLSPRLLASCHLLPSPSCLLTGDTAHQLRREPGTTTAFINPANRFFDDHLLSALGLFCPLDDRSIIQTSTPLTPDLYVALFSRTSPGVVLCLGVLLLALPTHYRFGPDTEYTIHGPLSPRAGEA